MLGYLETDTPAVGVIHGSNDTTPCLAAPRSGRPGGRSQFSREATQFIRGIAAFSSRIRTEGYCVSKVLLEKAACRFAEEHGMSLVTVCPAVTVGAAPASKVHISVPASLSLLSGDEAALGVLKGAEMLFGGVPMVDVDDLCRAQVFVAEEEASSGRYICCGLNTTVVQLARFLTHKYPRYNVETKLSSSGGYQRLETPRVRLSSGKLVKEGFEFKYKTLDAMYDDVVAYGKALGILPS